MLNLLIRIVLYIPLKMLYAFLKLLTDAIHGKIPGQKPYRRKKHWYNTRF